MMMMDSPEADSEQLGMLGMLGMQRTLRNHGSDGVGERTARFQILGVTYPVWESSPVMALALVLGLVSRVIGRGQFSVTINFAQGTPN